MIKSFSIAFLLCFIIFSLSCTGRPGENQDDKTGPGKNNGTAAITENVKKFLGNDIIAILENPDRVESFRVGLMKNPRAPKTLAGYPILFRGREMAPKQMEILSSIFLDERTYLFDVIKKCLFMPEYAFRVTKDGEMLLILVSYYCQEVTFFYRERELMEDFDNATDRVKLLTSSLVD